MPLRCIVLNFKTLFEMGMYLFRYDKVATANNVYDLRTNFTVDPVQWVLKYFEGVLKILVM